MADTGNEAGSTHDPAETGRREHGGCLAEARRLFPDAELPLLDLSTGINPVPYPVPDLPPDIWARLPEPDALESLEAAAARRYRIADPAAVVAAPGTQVLIGLLPTLLPQAAVTILGPTYNEHEAAWRRSGAQVREVASADDLGTQTAILCNPNNPDGRLVPVDTLLAIADRVAATGGLLVVDEAFADLQPEISLAPHLPRPGVVVLRSFGKTYGLAGLRLGFALAAPDLAGRLRAALGPWAVSGAATAIGTAALNDGAWLAAAATRLRRDADRLNRLLALAELHVIGGTSLFRLAAAAHAPLTFQRLGNAGIVARRFAAHPTWLRFGLPGTEAGWARLETALASL